MGDNNENENDPNGNSGSGPVKTHTQADLDRVAAAEKDQGRRSGQAEALKALGFEGKTLEDAKARFAALDALERSNLSETERVTREAAEAKAAADKALNEANTLSLKTKKVALLVESGSTLAQAALIESMIVVPVTASEADIKASIETLKTTFPSLFEKKKTEGDEGDGEGEGEIDPKTGKKKPVDSATGKPPVSGTKTKTQEEARSAATEQLYLRHPHLKPKS